LFYEGWYNSNTSYFLLMKYISYYFLDKDAYINKQNTKQSFYIPTTLTVLLLLLVAIIVSLNNPKCNNVI
jgi:hypothetical protein